MFFMSEMNYEFDQFPAGQHLRSWFYLVSIDDFARTLRRLGRGKSSAGRNGAYHRFLHSRQRTG